MNLILRTTLVNLKRIKSIDSNHLRHISLFAYQCQKVNSDDDVNEHIHSQFRNISERKLKKYLKEESKYNGKLVYVGQLTPALYRAKTLSLSSSLLGILLMPFLNQSLSAASIFSQALVYGTTGFFIFVTPLFAQLLTRRY